MAMHTRGSFVDELCSLSATLLEAGKIASSLREMHEAEIRSAVDDTKRKSRELAPQKTSSLYENELSYEVMNAERSSLRASAKIRPWNSHRRSSEPLPGMIVEDAENSPRDATVVKQNHRNLPTPGDSEQLGCISTITAPPEDEIAHMESISSYLTCEGVSGSPAFRNPVRKRLSNTFFTGGVREVWEDVRHDAVALVTERCSVRILGHADASNVQKSRTDRPSVLNRSTTSTSLVGACCGDICDCISGVMNPVGPFRFFWNAMCLLFIAYDLFMVPMQAFRIDDLEGLQVCEWILTIWWTFDVILTFRTGYIVGTRVETRHKQIAMHYAKTWLGVDLIIVTLEWINRFAVALGSASLLRSSRALRTFRFLKLFRITKMHNFWKSLQDQINSNVLHLLITMTILGGVLLLTIHITCCVWFAIGESRDDGWVTADTYQGDKNKIFWYVASFRWVVSQFNGRTDMDERRNMLERFFTCTVGITLAVIGQAVFISVITKTMLDLSELVSEKTHRQRIVNEYLETNPLPPTLNSQVKRCLYDYQDINQEIKKEDQVLAILPKHLQADVLFEVRAPVIMQHHFFHGLRFECPWVLRQICRKVVHTVSANKDEVVFDKGDVCDRMLFMDKMTASYGQPLDQSVQHAKYGTIDYESEGMGFFHELPTKLTLGGTKLRRGSTMDLLDGDHEPKTIPMGSWISEAAVWIDWRNQGRLVATAHGLLLGIQAGKLAQAMKRHPDAYALAFLYSKSIASELSSRDPGEMSDILPFEVHLHSPMCAMVSIVGANGLRNADSFLAGKSDPYCVCRVLGLTGKLGEVRFRTETIRDTLDPVWNYCHEVLLSRHQVLEFQVWDQDFGKHDSDLGICRLPADSFFPTGFEGRLELLPSNPSKSAKAQGSLDVKVEVRTVNEPTLSLWHQQHVGNTRKIGKSKKRFSDLIN